MAPKDISSAFILSGEYQRSFGGFYIKQLPGFFLAHGFFDYQMGSEAFEAELSAKRVETTHAAVQAGFGLGLRQFISPTFYLSFLAGGGYSFGSITLDFRNLEVQPKDTAGNEIAEKKIIANAPSASADLRLGFEAARRIAFEAGFLYQHLFFDGTFSGRLSIRAAVGVRF